LVVFVLQAQFSLP